MQVSFAAPYQSTVWKKRTVSKFEPRTYIGPDVSPLLAQSGPCRLHSAFSSGTYSIFFLQTIFALKIGLISVTSWWKREWRLAQRRRKIIAISIFCYANFFFFSYVKKKKLFYTYGIKAFRVKRPISYILIITKEEKSSSYEKKGKKKMQFLAWLMTTWICLEKKIFFLFTTYKEHGHGMFK